MTKLVPVMPSVYGVQFILTPFMLDVGGLQSNLQSLLCVHAMHVMQPIHQHGHAWVSDQTRTKMLEQDC
jgi:hypothetical protein